VEEKNGWNDLAEDISRVCLDTLKGDSAISSGLEETWSGKKLVSEEEEEFCASQFEAHLVLGSMSCVEDDEEEEEEESWFVRFKPLIVKRTSRVQQQNV
jgi:hypothetical protein